MKFWKSTLIALLVIGGPLCASTVQAQSRYNSWRQESNTVETIVRDLRALIDEADQARAADPRFLRDLRALANQYSNPWPVRLIQDNFQDGDFSNNPKWIVHSGFFETPFDGGLRSLAVAPVATRTQTEPRKTRPEDLAAILLGQILNQGRQRREPQQQASTPAKNAPETTPGEIYLETPISNAFSLTLKFKADALSEAFGVRFFQTRDRRAGYRLIHTPAHGFRLVRQGASGEIDIASAPTGLRLKTPHTLIWTRTANGAMTVTLDNVALFNVTDNGFRDNWRGLALTNSGGDITISNITVSGLR